MCELLRERKYFMQFVLIKRDKHFFSRHIHIHIISFYWNIFPIFPTVIVFPLDDFAKEE